MHLQPTPQTNHKCSGIQFKMLLLDNNPSSMLISIPFLFQSKPITTGQSEIQTPQDQSNYFMISSL